MRRIVGERGWPDTDVEDISQEVLIKLLAIPQERWSTIENVDGYVYRITKNQIIDYLNRRRSRPEISLDEAVIASTADTEQIRKAESGMLLRYLAESLEKPEERELLELIIIGYNEKEIAFRLGTTHTAARRRVARLKAKLRGAFDKRHTP